MSSNTVTTNSAQPSSQMKTKENGVSLGTESTIACVFHDEREGMDKQDIQIHAADMTGADHEDKRWPIIPEPEAGLCVQQNEDAEPSYQTADLSELEASRGSFVPDLEKKSKVKRGNEVGNFGDVVSIASGQQGTALKDVCNCGNLQRRVEDLESKVNKLSKGYLKHCVAGNLRRLKGNKEKGE